jgi:hypothetical protein
LKHLVENLYLSQQELEESFEKKGSSHKKCKKPNLSTLMKVLFFSLHPLLKLNEETSPKGAVDTLEVAGHRKVLEGSIARP